MKFLLLSALCTFAGANALASSDPLEQIRGLLVNCEDCPVVSDSVMKRVSELIDVSEAKVQADIVSHIMSLPNDGESLFQDITQLYTLAQNPLSKESYNNLLPIAQQKVITNANYLVEKQHSISMVYRDLRSYVEYIAVHLETLRTQQQKIKETMSRVSSHQELQAIASISEEHEMFKSSLKGKISNALNKISWE